MVNPAPWALPSLPGATGSAPNLKRPRQPPLQMRILFVSDDDRCRGPVARAVSELLARQADVHDCVFDSCGLDQGPSQPAYVEVITLMKREKLNLLNHRSKKLTEQLADSADIVFGMTDAIVAGIIDLLGDYYAPKVILLNKGVDLETTRMDVERPNLNNFSAIRQTYAMLRASCGRLVRTLEEHDVKVEYFGVKPVARRMKPGAAGPRASKATIDPHKRQYLVNMSFDYIERAFEPPTTTSLLQHLHSMGQEISALELSEILKQDLHGFARQDKDGAWHLVTGAGAKRRAQAKAQARARAEEQRAEEQRAKEPPPPPPPAREERLTEEGAYEVLSITPETTRAEAQKKFRALLQRYHPDRFHDDPEFQEMADQKTKRINEAWAMLKDKLADEPVV